MVGTLEVSNYSKILSETLTNEEKTIVELKYKSTQFGQMSDIELLNECRLLLLRLSVITGWIIPQAELKNILIENLCKKMVESYPNVNVGEVEYAFRNKGIEIKDWGKSFSITLLDEVMMPYIERRFGVSDLEQRIKRSEIHRLYTDGEIINERRGDIEMAYQTMRSGRIPIVHRYFEEVLRADELMDEGENLSEFFVRKLNNQAENIYRKNETS